MLNDFITYLNEQVRNMSIYVWGAQGQKYPVLNAEWIKSKESNLIHRRDALKTFERACTKRIAVRLTVRGLACTGCTT